MRWLPSWPVLPQRCHCLSAHIAPGFKVREVTGKMGGRVLAAKARRPGFRSPEAMESSVAPFCNPSNGEAEIGGSLELAGSQNNSMFRETLCQKVKMESGKETRPVLTSGLHMHLYICVYTLTKMETPHTSTYPCTHTEKKLADL